MVGNQVVGKEVARRVEGAIKVNLLSTNLLILNILHSHSEKCLGKRFVKKGISWRHETNIDLLHLIFATCTNNVGGQKWQISVMAIT